MRGKNGHAPWPKPSGEILAEIDLLMKQYRTRVEECLSPLVSSYYPSLAEKDGGHEYRKMLELSTKMTMVGHACTQAAGHVFDERRQRISSLYGACCFLGDSFLDNFGEAASRKYLERYEVLLTKGWFEIEDQREQLFYIVLLRLFAERDILGTMLRQAILSLFLAQKRDVQLRLNAYTLHRLSRRQRLNLLKRCARDRSGHAITVLVLFLVPGLPLKYHHLIFTAGSLIMYIDDHGDCHFDRYYHRITYMNQLKYPAQTLRRLFHKNIMGLYRGLPQNEGRDLLTGFLFRYFVTRLRKHRLEKGKGSQMWTVYE